MEIKYIKYFDKWIEKESPSLWLKIKSLFKSGDISENIEYWLLEINEDGSIKREISIGENGQIISIAPFESNRGLWVDSMVFINSKDYESITAREFIDKWEKAIQTL